VVEIGSNDGLFLKALQSAGIRVLGVDPAKNIASVANASAIPTINEFFSAELGREIRRRYGPATAIVGNNVVAHIDDHHDLVAGIAELLTDDGIFVFEAPYLGDMFENISYDTIYHEHLSYLSLRPLIRLFDQYGLDVFDVQFFPVQGRSMRTFVGRKGAHRRSMTVDRVAEDELARGFHQLETYHSLATRIAESRDRLLTVLRSFKEQGKSLAGYGAPAKGNTMLNYCGIGTDLLDYLIDDLPSKQGMFAPGTHLPVRQRAYLDTHPVDVLLMLAWNYQDSIVERERSFRERGGRFVIPVRGVEVA
jgi:SAM-dependent methyltransferase